MAQEIERKFLVSDESWRVGATGSLRFQQGYLSSNSKATVRVRSKDDSRAVITLKSASRGMSRAEYEYDIPIEDARELLELAQPHVIAKTRHLVPFGGLTWEVDVFEGKLSGLVMAEVELSREDQQVELPGWAGREVTDDDRYFNASLARADGPPDETL
jgi:adenylate cyclase